MKKQDLLLFGEEITDLQAGELMVIQARSGYRFSIDPVLLSGFARIRPGNRVADLGTGSGIIPLILARRQDQAHFIGLECQPAMVERARRSTQLNGLQERVEILHGNVRTLPPELKAQSFDVVTMNPPYRPSSAGRIAPDKERALARHELAGGVLDFLQSAATLLVSSGYVFLIFPAERMAELLSDMRAVKLEPKRLRMVHARQGQEAKLVLAEGRKNGRPGLTVEPPLFIYKGEGRDYSEEVLAMYGEPRETNPGALDGQRKSP